MILHHFQTWARTAPASARADGVSALARAYLYSDLDPEMRRSTVHVLTEFLDDPSPLVRAALATALAGAREAPHHIIVALADDQAEVAALVLARSPVLTDAELIDCAATAGATAQAAIAVRPHLSAPVAAALAEVAGPVAAITLAANRSAALPTFSVRRMVERHGDDADLREALLTRPDLPACVRIDLVAATTRALAAFVTQRNWMSGERMNRVAIEAKDKAAITIAGTHCDALRDLVAHLRESGHLTVSLAFRAILSGKVELFKAILSELSGVPLGRVAGFARQCDTMGFAALYRKAGLPPALLPAFRAALHATTEADWSDESGLSRSAIERVLTACESINSGELDMLLVLLRRLESEAARDQARAGINRAKLSLGSDEAPSSLEPLLLTDLDADVGQLRDNRGFDRSSVRRESRPLAIDLVAMEAQLLAA